TDVGVAALERCRADQRVAVGWVVDVDAAALGVEALSQRRRAHVLRPRGPDSELGRGLVRDTGLPGVRVAAAAVLGYTERLVEVQLTALQQRNAELEECLPHVVSAADRALAREQ